MGSIVVCIDINNISETAIRFACLFAQQQKHKLHIAIAIDGSHQNFLFASRVIGSQKRNEVRYALAEFQGIIIGVFEILHWYPIQTNNNTNNNRWGFEGIDASENIKSKYLNTSIMHAKKRGAANPIRFRL